MELKKLSNIQIKEQIEDHKQTLKELCNPDGSYCPEDRKYATEQRAKLDTLRMELHKRRTERPQVYPR